METGKERMMQKLCWKQQKLKEEEAAMSLVVCADIGLNWT